MAEMEQKWAHELDDVREGILQPSAAFFNDFHLQEVTQYYRFGTLKELVGSQWRLEFIHSPLGIFSGSQSFVSMSHDFFWPFSPVSLTESCPFWYGL